MPILDDCVKCLRIEIDEKLFEVWIEKESFSCLKVDRNNNQKSNNVPSFYIHSSKEEACSVNVNYVIEGDEMSQ